MQATWYERTGPASEVLQVGALPDLLPVAGEVRVRLAVSGVNPSDVKRRSGWNGQTLTFPLVIPNNDGAGFAST